MGKLARNVALVLWSIVGVFGVLTITVAPGAINAVLGIGTIAIIMTVFAVIDRRVS